MGLSMACKSGLLLLLLLALNACAPEKHPDLAALYGPAAPQQRVLDSMEAVRREQLGYVSYWRDVKPLLERRCVVCHACYDAPCQLKLGSFEGLDRGATKQLVYDSKRLHPAQPTRLFIDANDTGAWRSKQFFPVLNERADEPVAALDNSLLAKMLLLKRDHPLPGSGKLPESFDFELNRPLECPTIDEFADYKAKHPRWGMPYALPGLDEREHALLLAWLEQGAKAAARPELSAATGRQIAAWEEFLNAPSAKRQLASRYIYEHLFSGHIHLQGDAQDTFFRLVRSATPPGVPLAEVPTVLPYDDPGSLRIYYRLRPVTESIADKIHFVYEFSPERMQRYRELFLDPDYPVTELPGYTHELAANPFKTFAALPVTSRYRFLLDDAEFFVAGFIKGPVCRGQIALNVIQDRFWVAFIKPGMPFVEHGAKFLEENSDYLTLPGAKGDRIGLFGWRGYNELGQEYLRHKELFIEQAILRGSSGFGLDYLWNGEGVNQNAALTVFRHFDSASVVKGWLGDTPKTAWVIDYPIFERLHYLLVAGFNVYGSVGHQLATRKYMDYLRIDAENNFLRFMPAAQRQPMRDGWYQGIGPALEGLFEKPLFNIAHESGVEYKSTDYKQEFFRQLRARWGAASGMQDNINDCGRPPCFSGGVSAVRREADAAMRELAALQGRVLGVLPEVSFLRVEAGPNDADLVYTVLADKALSNISFIFAEELRRLPAQDRITVVPGFLGSYPNFFFSVPKQQLRAFIDALQAIRTPEDKDRFYGKYGIRRSDARFWQYADWFGAQYRLQKGVYAGIFDLNRYENL